VGKIAAVQMNSSADVDENLNKAEGFIREAAQQGAEVVVLPEMFAMMGKHESDKLTIKETLGDGPIQTWLSKTAGMNNIWVIAGTIPISSNDPNRAFASCLVYDTYGSQVSHYNKLHLFDVDIRAASENYRESETTLAGWDIIDIESPVGQMGFAVCYDVRFPELFRLLIRRNVDLFVLPSAFTEATGRAHWHSLLRCRAIENLSYMVAACQVGKHANGRRTYGHSMIVDPWGDILAELPEEEGIIVADIDLARVKQLRREFPVLEGLGG
tara:strand:- start:24530 stop:25339 length:810 start_codon:yes stop_codon:yes gene_type:complete